MANLLNSLTTKTSIHTTIQYEAKDAEVFFFTDQGTPGDLEMRLAEVRARVKASPSRPSSSEVPVTAVPDAAGQLLRLGEMLDKGQPSPREFAMAKSRLFAGPN